MTNDELQSAEGQRNAIMNYQREELANAFSAGLVLIEFEKSAETHLHALIEETLDFHMRNQVAALSEDDDAFLETVVLLLANGADPNAALRWAWAPGLERDYAQGETPRSLVEQGLQTEPKGARLLLLERLRDALNARG